MVEIDGKESYGWWPKRPVGLQDTLFGIEGELNGQTEFRGQPTIDPHHGRYGGADAFNVYGEMTQADAIMAIRDFANSYSGGWSWPFGQNCHSFQDSMLDHIGLTIK